MSVLALIIADMETDFFGCESTLARQIDGKSVLLRTVEKTLALDGVDHFVLACPTGQAGQVTQALGGVNIDIVEFEKGGNRRKLLRQARSFARYGWRGGIAEASIFDEVMEPLALDAACKKYPSAAVMLVPGGAMFLDIAWANKIIDRMLADGGHFDYVFNQAPVGLSAGIFALQVVANIFEAQTHFGRLLGYDPTSPRHDVVFTQATVKLDDAIVNTPRRFLADSPRGFWLCEKIYSIVGAGATGEYVCKAAKNIGPEPWPRELTVELTCRRGIEDKLRPTTERSDMDMAALEELFVGLESAGDINIMFDGTGDMLLHDKWDDFVRFASKFGAVGLSTYLSQLDDELVEKLLSCGLSVLQVNLDAFDRETYDKYKTGGDFDTVMQNIDRLTKAAAERGQVCPSIVPFMTKTPDMLDQQEAFYDSFAQSTGWSVISEPSTYCGDWPEMGVYDMSPPLRGTCRRLANRLTVLSDGRVTACDEDMISGALVLNGNNILKIWCGDELDTLRCKHDSGKIESLDRCVKCREFHRP